MSFEDEERQIQRLREESERRKRELERLQEEELMHIRELERLRQMKGAEDEYNPEMDSAFDVMDTGSPQIPQGRPQQRTGYEGMERSQQRTGYEGVERPQQRTGYEGMERPQQRDAMQRQRRPQQGTPQQGRSQQGRPQQGEDMSQGRNRDRENQLREQRRRKQPVQNTGYDDDDDGADFDVEAFRAAERAKKRRMQNRYGEEEEPVRRSGRKGGSNSRRAEEDAPRRERPVKERKPRRRRNPIKKIILTLLIILLVLVLIAGVILNSILSKFKHFDSEVSKRESSMRGSQINVLLIGQDAREGEEAQRSDTMILCTINKSNHTVILTSFMRDMYVDIPGHGGNRINAAYAIGGVDLLDQTIEENFGVTIDGNAMVDLTSFLESMTAVGDIEMELNAEEAAYMMEHPEAGTATDISDEVWDLHEGVNSLTPAQALCYARMRYVGNSDWERTERQRKLIMACVDKVKSGHLLQGIKMAKNIAPCISSDLSKTGFLKLGWGFIRGGGMQSYRLPVDGTYYNDNINGMAVLVPDISTNQSYLQEYMSGEYSEDEE